MRVLLFVTVALVISSTTAASIPDTPGRTDNVIVLEVGSKGPVGDRRDNKEFPEEQDGEPFEIIVPVARNFSSLEELFKILREDDPKEPRGAFGTPPTYVKGTESNSSEYLIFLTDGVGNSKGSS